MVYLGLEAFRATNAGIWPMTTTPTNAFKAWADRECGKWPATLQAEAYMAWQVMLHADGTKALNAFTEKYRQWEASQS